MRLGLELIASQPVTLRLGTFFETWIALPSGTLRRSLGRDEYHLTLPVSAGGRLAATGRTHIAQVDLEDAGLGTNQARSAVLVPTEIPEDGPVVWSVRTNLFLRLADLQAGAEARLLRDGLPPVTFGLEDPLVEASEVAPGRYVLELSQLLKA